MGNWFSTESMHVDSPVPMEEASAPRGKATTMPAGRMRQRLTEISNETGTDKGTMHGDAHAYTLIYEMLFEPMRDRAVNLLEIGLAIGGPEHDVPASRDVSDAPSMRMWRRYFPRAQLFGIDISDFSTVASDRFRFFQADCGDGEQLDKVVADLQRDGATLDIIVDDGSHASFHQQLTMLKLFPLLRSGGLYIIEDLNWQPKSYEVALPRVPKTSKLLQSLLQTGRLVDTGSISKESWQALVLRIASIVLFEEDYLLHLRRGHNARWSIRPARPSHIETSLPKRFIHRRHARHIAEQARKTLLLLATGVGPVYAGRTTLAVIQKH